VGRRSVAALAVFALIPAAGGGCSTTASIEMKTGGTVEAHVVGGSPNSVYLVDREHGKFTLRRDDIRDVDLPGNVMLLAGAGLFAAGGVGLWFGDTHCASFGETGTCAASVVPAIAGLLAAAWGAYVYRRSARALHDTSRPEPDAVMKPRAPRQPGQEPYPGWRKPDPFADPHP
jgi:hypothetical protein